MIGKEDYNRMEEGLSDYLEEMMKEGKIDVEIEGDSFIVPAKILVIRRKS